MFTILGLLLSGVGLAFGVYKFWWQRRQRSAAQAVSDTSHAMMEDEENRPTSVDDAISKL